MRRIGRRGELTVGVQRLAVRRANTEDAGDEDVLERRDEEQCRVLKADNIELFRVDDRWNVPAPNG